MYPKILEVSKITGVPVANILDFLFYIKDGKPVDNTDLINKTGISKNALNKIKSHLRNYLKPSSNNTILLKRYLDDVDEMLQGYRLQNTLYKFLNNSDYDKALDVLNKHKKLAVSPQRKYDQFIASHDTVARRASLLNFLGDIREKNILFLGDDDFSSIAISSLGLANQVSVIDIDKKVLQKIKQIAALEKYKIETEIYDARNTLPRSVKNRFDVVFTDPPYTPAGTKLFLSRAIECLDNRNNAARIYVCYGESDASKEKGVPILEAIQRLGLTIRYVFDIFNHYTGAVSIGSSSNLFVCEVNPKTKPTITGNYDKKIYTNNYA